MSPVPDPTLPQLYARRVLVCLSGLTPQVVTETLYALLTAPQPFVPTELHLVTTAEGAHRARDLLLGEHGVLKALWAEHAPADAALKFDPNRHLHLITEGDQVLQDVTQSGHPKAELMTDSAEAQSLGIQARIHCSPITA